MKRRHWESQKKFQIVLEGLKGRGIGDICAAYQISQAQYYKWRDQFLGQGHRIFELTESTQKKNALQKENEKLKQAVGELTLELKKNDGYYR